MKARLMPIKCISENTDECSAINDQNSEEEHIKELDEE